MLRAVANGITGSGGAVPSGGTTGQVLGKTSATDFATGWINLSSVAGQLVIGQVPDALITNAKLADMAEATFKMRAAAAGTGVPIDGTAAQARLALALEGVALDNRLINGEFRIWQRGTSLSAQADDSYGAMGDRWYILTQTSTIAGARQAAPFDGALNSGQLTQSQAVAQRIGVAQLIENKNCQDLRGQAVTFFGRFQISADQDVRVAIGEWTGTADSPTSDIVNDWTSATYTAGNFFIATTTTITAVKEYALPGTGWVDFSITGTLSSTANNVWVFLWTEGTAAQNVTLGMANCGFVRGSVAPAAYTPRQFTQELALCQRYYQKSFALDTEPVQNVASTTGIWTYPQIGGAASGARGPFCNFPVWMRSTPTMTSFNPSAANAEARNIDAALDNNSLSFQRTAPNGFSVQWNTNAGSAANQQSGIHWTAASEL